ncbi:MAG: xanthine dehydrogenase family protein molybdopterin-binding subunit [Anaerolineales bacterium]|nr:xanthine dehydrogenase family protein molybdopterin-binding subunit [Anaerolineales bacterium]MCB9126331.1 xanthine dehydrogenase family protein molybdopterin-binding subunit [Ardenticatenales bacterium]
MSEKKRRWTITRRGFLIGAGSGAGLLALGVGLGLPRARLSIADRLDGATAPGGLEATPDLWFELGETGKLRLYLPKVEMGQGIHTALAQIAAAELGVTLDDLEILQATSRVGPQDSSGTQGSASVITSYEPIRQAAAALRETLRSAASEQWGQPLDQIVQEGASFFAKGDTATRLSFGELAAGQREWTVPDEVTLRPTAELTLIGQSVPRIDIPSKVNGAAVYGYDARMDGMRYGASAHKPSFEAEFVRLRNESAVAAMAGVEAVVVEGEAGFVGVVATTRRAAWQARDALDIEWREGKRWSQREIEELVTVGGRGGVAIQREGHAEAMFGQGTISAEYRTPLAAHMPMEPQAALADATGDGVRVWVSTQMQARTADAVASALGREVGEIEIIPTYLGGGFGRKGISEVAIEAARLSEAVGVPVHVGWTREEETQNGYFRPPTHHQFRAVLEKGRVTAIEHQQASGDVLFAYFPAPLRFLFGVDFGAWRGGRIAYEVANRHVVAWRRKLPVPTGPWRGLGLLANTFALESFFDELAYVAGTDPLSFRLAHLNSDAAHVVRLRAALDAVRALSSWDAPPAAGRARGVACSFDAGTAVALVVEASLDGETPIVHHVWAVMDCGQLINPDTATAQVEGNVIWGLSSALLEQATLAEGRITNANFADYPILPPARAPEITVQLINPTDAPPGGVGEPAIGPVPAALANALFRLDGKRRRDLPLV